MVVVCETGVYGRGGAWATSNTSFPNRPFVLDVAKRGAAPPRCAASPRLKRNAETWRNAEATSSASRYGLRVRQSGLFLRRGSAPHPATPGLPERRQPLHTAEAGAERAVRGREPATDTASPSRRPTCAGRGRCRRGACRGRGRRAAACTAGSRFGALRSCRRSCARC